MIKNTTITIVSLKKLENFFVISQKEFTICLDCSSKKDYYSPELSFHTLITCHAFKSNLSFSYFGLSFKCSSLFFIC